MRERLNLSKKDVIELFNNGKTIRTTCGVWNNPRERGEIAKSVKDIESLYNWAYHVDVYQIEDGIIDVVGASGGDMF